MILGVTNFFSSMLVSVVSALAVRVASCWSCRDVALQGERLMLVVERNPSNEDMWVILSGGLAEVNVLDWQRICSSLSESANDAMQNSQSYAMNQRESETPPQSLAAKP